MTSVQKLYLDDKLLDGLEQRAKIEQMEVGDFARECVEVLLKRDPDFKQRYDAAAQFEAKERAKSKKR
ncbi:Uncharacterised protein [uncultured archaeon]|nr:Uncharacterised protein [uncultured archaeon]